MTERFARRLASAALALALAISGCSVASPSATSNSAAYESSAEGPSDAPGFMWARASRLPVVREHSVVVAAAPVGDGFVAFSLDGEGGQTDLWHSPDGRTWESVSPRGDPVSGITGVLAAEGRLLAFGNGGNGEEVRAAFWTSEDGVTWRRAQADFDDGQVIDAVAGDDGFVAVGQGIWTSNSGETWTRIADTGQLGGSFLWAVARGGPGFVAVGWRPNPEPDLVVWTSVNGRDWGLAPDTPGGRGFEGRDVVERDGMLVMVGDRVGGGTAGVWTSTDAVTWRAAEPSASFGASAMVRVIATRSGLLAVGSRNVDDAGVWTSSDGRAWEAVDDLVFADAYLTDATVADGVVVLVGATQKVIAGSASYTSAAAAWYGEIKQR
jgi:hypothetical protein